MGYAQVQLYYMTGTGNSYRTATFFAQAAQNKGVPVQVAPIQTGELSSEAVRGRQLLIGLVMPTHGFTSPWPMLRFALGLPLGRGTHIFVVPTRAGMKFGPLYTPGMEGTAGYLLALVLLAKGYGIRGVMGLDMPSNWLSLHPGLRLANASAIIQRAHQKCAGFMDSLLAGRRRFVAGSFVQLFLGLLLLPISMGYLVVGRFYLAKLFFANNKCNGCGMCADNCPHQAIRMRGKKKPRPYWTFDCESCMRCMGYCPQKAVEAGHSLGLLLYMLITIPVGHFLLHHFGTAVVTGHSVASIWLERLVQYPYMLLSIFLCYLLVSALIRIPLINNLFAWTTLTRFYRRYHEPATRLFDIRVNHRHSGKKEQD